METTAIMASVLPIIEITVSPKLSASKYVLDVQLRDIANQVSMLLYGLKYTSGGMTYYIKSNQLLIFDHQLKKSKFIIRLPDMKPIPKAGNATLHNFIECEEITKDIKAMVKHASQAGIKILVS